MTTPQTSSAPVIPGRRSPSDPTGSPTGAVPRPGARPPRGGFARRVERSAVRGLSAYSVAALRTSLGLVFLGFGALKLVPGLSPAAGLATRTVETLTFGLVPGGAALLLTAVMECAVGLALVTGRLLRTGLAVLGVSLVGILSPLVLFTADLFPGAPTLEAQYVLKDVVLVTAAMVVAATALGARLVPPS
jgi:uncharacterized membrane protein YphA (DoxX/SURF4 family)